LGKLLTRMCLYHQAV